jgi:hypothetical protein
MKAFKTFLVLLISLLFMSCAQAADNTFTAWHGTYNYSGSGGREAAGIAVFLDITLTISSSGDCKINREGYQIMDSMVCSVSKNYDGIDILFKSYPGGKTENMYGVAVYKPGERLFSLFPKNGGKTLITDWGRLKPEGYAKKSRGVFFKRKGGK